MRAQFGTETDRGGGEGGRRTKCILVGRKINEKNLLA